MSSDHEKTTSEHSGARQDSANAQSRAIDRRSFLVGAAAGAAGMAFLPSAVAEEYPALAPLLPYQDDLNAIRTQVEKRHDEAVQRLQQWIRQPSIAAENRGVNEGCELTMQMLRDAGFNQGTKIPTDG